MQKARKTWMARTSSAKTRFALLPGHDEFEHGGGSGYWPWLWNTF